MLDWGAIGSGLLEWAAALAGVSSDRAQWADEPLRVLQPPEPVITLQLVGLSSSGTDETDWAPRLAELVPTVSGHREMTVQVSVDVQTQRLEGHAIGVAEAMRTRARADTAIDSLADLGLGLGSVGPLISVPGRAAGGRLFSRALFELHLTGLSAVEGAPSVPIETASIQLVGEDVDGSVIYDETIVTDTP